MDNISSNQQNQFSAAQEKRLNDFSDKIKEFENSFNEQKKEQLDNYTSTFDKLNKSAEGKLQSMKEIQDKIEKYII